MGSTLTNTQPKDTYKSLLKTSDSTELSGTAKYVSDGNGNDSALALSTGNIGIGTTSPAAKLHVEDSGNGTIRFGGSAGLEITHDNSGNTTAEIKQLYAATSASAHLKLTSGYTTFNVGTSGNEIARINSNGLTFNGDTAAANALDDYEEGTWTPTDDSGAGLTLTFYDATYTKIGRLVQIEASIYWPSTADASQISVSGLPFTAATGDDNTGGISITSTNSGRNDFWLIIRGSSRFVASTNVDGTVTNANYSGKKIKFFGTYHV